MRNTYIHRGRFSPKDLTLEPGKLDNSMLLEISEVAMRDLELAPDLLIVNRFGRSEAEGHGFRQVIEKAFLTGIPVLTAVKDEYYDDWKAFSAELGHELSPDLSEVLAWYHSAISAQHGEDISPLKPA